MRITLLTQAVAIFGGVISLGTFIYAVDYTEVLYDGGFQPSAIIWLFGVAFLFLMHFWVIVPFGLVYWCAAGFSSSKIASWLFLLTAFIATASSAYIYWDVFVALTDPDPQDGLFLFFIPLYQLAVFFVIKVLCDIIMPSCTNRTKNE